MRIDSWTGCGDIQQVKRTEVRVDSTRIPKERLDGKYNGKTTTETGGQQERLLVAAVSVMETGRGEKCLERN